MKKITGLLLLSMVLVLAACGSDTVKISEDDKSSSEGSEKKIVEKKEDAVEVDENVQEDDSLKTTNTYTNKELAISGEVGSMKYEIPAIQLKVIEPKNQETADMFDVAIGDKVHAITVKLNGENTSEEDMNFYLGQATVITDTKEQLEPDMFLSEHIDGEYLGQVAHEGFNVYVLKKSTVEDLNTVEVRISAPTNSNWDTIGEDVKHVIEVNK